MCVSAAARLRKGHFESTGPSFSAVRVDAFQPGFVQAFEPLGDVGMLPGQVGQFGGVFGQVDEESPVGLCERGFVARVAGVAQQLPMAVADGSRCVRTAANVPVQDADVQGGLAKLIRQLEPGDEVIISENQQPVAKLVGQAGRFGGGNRDAARG